MEEEPLWFSPGDYLLGGYQEIRLPVDTHIDMLDKMLGGGWGPGMWAIMAVPGVGKSAFALYNALLVAWGGIPCAYLSLEMNAAQCWHRIASSFSATRAAKSFGIESFGWGDVPAMSIATQRIMATEGIGIADMNGRDQFVTATNVLVTEPIPATGRPMRLHIASGNRLRDLDVVLATIDEARAMGCGLVVVDYLQLISPRGGTSQYEKLTEVSHALAVKAAELGMPILVICAMNRESMKGQAKPTMHDASGTAAIEYDATGILTISKIEDESTADVRRVEVRLHKNRQGRSGCSLLFDYKPAFNTFEAIRRID